MTDLKGYMKNGPKNWSFGKVQVLETKIEYSYNESAIVQLWHFSEFSEHTESAETQSISLPEVKRVWSYLCPESPAHLLLGVPVQRCFPKTLLSAFKSPTLTQLTQQREGRFLAWLALSYKEGKPLKALLNNVCKLPKILLVFSYWTSSF